MKEPAGEQAAIRGMRHEFVKKEVTPYAAGWDRTGTAPLETVFKIGRLGLFGVCVPVGHHNRHIHNVSDPVVRLAAALVSTNPPPEPP